MYHTDISYRLADFRLKPNMRDQARESGDPRPRAKYNVETKTMVTYSFQQSSCWFYHFTVVLTFINSCINPFIYAAKYRPFQTGVRRKLYRCSSCKYHDFQPVMLANLSSRPKLLSQNEDFYFG